jgi:hypothetical protein
MLEKAQANNKSLGVTGALVYHDGNFAQMLEGPKDIVLNLFEKISKDPRHFGVIKIEEGPIQKREFENWSMSFQNVHKLPEDLLKANPILNTPLTSAELAANPSRALQVFRLFKQHIMKD